VMSASLKAALQENTQYRQDIEKNTPLSRIASPGELADAVQYLASDGSAFMTGQILTVDGGRTLLDPVAVPAH
jgi:7-alpha-hydroxysteroid dehydrogenase